MQQSDRRELRALNVSGSGAATVFQRWAQERLTVRLCFLNFPPNVNSFGPL